MGEWPHVTAYLLEKGECLPLFWPASCVHVFWRFHPSEVWGVSYRLSHQKLRGTFTEIEACSEPMIERAGGKPRKPSKRDKSAVL